MSRHYIYAFATETVKSGARDGVDVQIRTRTGRLLTPKGYETLRRNVARGRTVFQLWGKQRPGRKTEDNPTRLTVMLSIFDLKTMLLNERHVLLLDVAERDGDDNIIREEKRVLSPYEACRWLIRHGHEQIARGLFPGRTRKQSRHRINFNSRFFRLRTAPSSVFASLLNVIIIILLLLTIPFILVVVYISAQIEDVGAVDHPASAMTAFTENAGQATVPYTLCSHYQA